MLFKRCTGSQAGGFCVVVKRSRSGLVAQSPRIHYLYTGCTFVPSCSILLPPPPEPPPKKRTIELLSHTSFCCVYFEEMLWPSHRFAWCSPWPAGLCSTPECSTLLSISRSIHYSSVPPLAALHRSCLRALWLSRSPTPLHYSHQPYLSVVTVNCCLLFPITTIVLFDRNESSICPA